MIRQPSAIAGFTRRRRGLRPASSAFALTAAPRASTTARFFFQISSYGPRQPGEVALSACDRLPITTGCALGGEMLAFPVTCPFGMPAKTQLTLPKPSGRTVSQEQRDEWKQLLALRDQALLQLDALKKEAGMNKALDAEAVYYLTPADRARFEPYGVDLEDVVGAGSHTIESAPAGGTMSVKMIDRRESYKACARSWKRRADVGTDAEFPDLSARDAEAVRKLKK